MKFREQFYFYQNDILAIFEKEIQKQEKKIHIVAPPWAWKTIVWLEMIVRLNCPTLILVPNTTLQYQWKDKLEKLFLENWENIDDLVSTSTEEIKKINIITYQALTQTWDDCDLIMHQILQSWHKDLKDEFESFEEFEKYVEWLKVASFEEYSENISKYKKKQKNLDNVEKMLSTKVFEYFDKLKANWISAIIVDEAHHLTAWRSAVLFYLWKFLGEKFIIWLTATPPFEDADFFVLDEDYSNLLWEVDYYVPQPAIVKSWRLAPYQDLVYFVEPGKEIAETLAKYELDLNSFLTQNKATICEVLYKFIKEDFEKLLKKKWNSLINYIKFIKNNSALDISEFVISEEIGLKLNLEDIAKSVGKYITLTKIKNITEKITPEEENQETKENSSNKEENAIFDNIKKLFYNLGYIWRWANFYRFRTPVELLLIYSKTKINGVIDIIDKELEAQWENVRIAIITDFLDENENNYLNCNFLLSQLKEKYKHLNPTLVSGQWNYNIDENWNPRLIDENIISITAKFEKWETKLLIGTRWILGEWWDCPKLNSLIDLTWVQAYMTVNQVRWRWIRLDLDNPQKVANIYDIVCIGEWYKWDIDVKRLVSKHEKFYWIDDSWLIIKWVDHIYPNLEDNYKKYKEINTNMLVRIGLRKYIHDLWWVWWEYENKEIFGLHLEIEEILKFFPYVKVSIFNIFKIKKMFVWNMNLKNIGDSYYFVLIKKFLDKFLKSITETLKQSSILPQDFTFWIEKDNYGNFKIISKYKDALVSKAFITYLSTIFSTITTQKYVLELPILTFENEEFKEKNMYWWLPEWLSKNKGIRENFLWKLVENNYLEKFLGKLSLNNIFENKKNWKILVSLYKKYAIILFILIIFSFFGKNIIWTDLSGFLITFMIFGLILPPFFLVVLWIPYKIINFLIGKIKWEVNYSLLWNNFFDKYFPSISYYLLTNKTIWTKEINFININSDEINKKDYISQKPFINWKIEKLWI